MYYEQIAASATPPFVVARILTPSRVVLNCGSSNGVANDSRFVIYRWDPQVVDPKTEEPLEPVFLQRGLAKVVVLQKLICTVESIRTRSVGFLADRQVAPFEDVMIEDLAFLIEPTTPEGKALIAKAPF